MAIISLSKRNEERKYLTQRLQIQQFAFLLFLDAIDWCSLRHNFFSPSHCPALTSPAFFVIKLRQWKLAVRRGEGTKFRIQQKLGVVTFWSWNLEVITKEFWEETIQFHRTFHALKIKNWVHVSQQLYFRFHHETKKNHAKLFHLHCWGIFQLSKFIQQLSA